MAPSTIAIIILVLTAIAFAVPRIPIAVTAILASLAMVITGILEPSEALGMFGNDTVIMIAGTSVLATAIFETGLAGRVGRGIMRWHWAVKSEVNFILVMFLVTTALSTVMGNVAVLAIMYPIASSVISESGFIRRKSLYMTMAIASCLGGNVTLAGSSMNMLAQGILETTEGVEAMGFFTLTRGSLPSIAISLVYFMTVGRKLQERVFSGGDGKSDGESGHRPFVRDKAVITACCFVLCIAGFIAGVWTIGMTALLAATICILTGCVSFKTAMLDMDWTTVCVLAGALGFAKGVNDSGAGQVIAEYGLSLLGGPGCQPARGSVYAGAHWRDNHKRHAEQRSGGDNAANSDNDGPDYGGGRHADGGCGCFRRIICLCHTYRHRPYDDVPGSRLPLFRLCQGRWTLQHTRHSRNRAVHTTAVFVLTSGRFLPQRTRFELPLFAPPPAPCVPVE